MRDCDNCGRPVDGESCISCGYGKKMVSINSLAKFMPLPKRDHQETAAARARMREVLAGFRFARPGKDWARKILERRDRGDSLPPISIEFAREALNMNERGDAYEAAE